jgi:hypothetical protein
MVDCDPVSGDVVFNQSDEIICDVFHFAASCSRYLVGGGGDATMAGGATSWLAVGCLISRWAQAGHSLKISSTMRVVPTIELSSLFNRCTHLDELVSDRLTLILCQSRRELFCHLNLLDKCTATFYHLSSISCRRKHILLCLLAIVRFSILKTLDWASCISQSVTLSTIYGLEDCFACCCILSHMKKEFVSNACVQWTRLLL